jgi:hypothetical protein
VIEVHHEEGVEDLQSVERCCFCRNSTRFWYKPKDVACCRECALRAEPEDVPTKKVWCRRERIAYRGFM